MTAQAEPVPNPGHDPGRFPWRVLWLIPPALLAIPLLFAWPWTTGDYVFALVMFGIAGALIELAGWASANAWYRSGAILAVVASFSLVWVNAAVGILGGEGNPANLLFLGVIGIAALGALLAGFRASGTSQAMAAAALAQVAVCVGAWAFGLGSPGRTGLYEAAFGVALFAPLWAGSAWLFAKAAVTPAP